MCNVICKKCDLIKVWCVVFVVIIVGIFNVLDFYFGVCLGLYLLFGEVFFFFVVVDKWIFVGC